MSGNVWDWCLDNRNDRSDNTTPEFTRAYRDSDGSRRVFRGGSWNGYAQYCRSANRNKNYPVRRRDGLGLRLALVQAE